MLSVQFALIWYIIQMYISTMALHITNVLELSNTYIVTFYFPRQINMVLCHFWQYMHCITKRFNKLSYSKHFQNFPRNMNYCHGYTFICLMYCILSQFFRVFKNHFAHSAGPEQGIWISLVTLTNSSSFE